MTSLTPWRWILQYGWTARRSFLLGGLSLFATNVFHAMLPWTLKEAVESLRAGDATLTTSGRYPLLILVLASLVALCRTWSRSFIYSAGREVEYVLRNDVIAHILTLPLAYARQGKVGDLISRASNDTSDVRMMVGPGYLQVLNTVFTYIVTLSMMVILDPGLTLVTLVPYVILVVAFHRMSRLTHAYSLAVQEQLGLLSTQVQENLSGLMIIKSFRMEGFEDRRFQQASAELRRRHLKFAVLRSLIWPFVGLVSGIAVVVLFYVGGRKVIEGSMTLGELVAFQSYLVLLIWPAIGLGWIINVIQRGLAATGRIQQILRVPSQASVLGEAADVLPDRGALSLRDVSHQYPVTDRGVTDLTFEIPAGAHVALVGRTGSGKSTLSALPPRLLEPAPGTLFIDGIDVTKIPLHRLREKVVLLPQESYLFSVTILENILFGVEDRTETDAHRAADDAGIGREVQAFPEGFRTQVGERGVTLSGGQRQRTALARSLVRDALVLILDDAFSSVDTQTERAILERIRSLRAGKTTILISHRISTVMDCDRIFVLGDGRLVEQGSHEELVAQGGEYAAMVRHQMLEEDLARDIVPERPLPQEVV